MPNIESEFRNCVLSLISKGVAVNDAVENAKYIFNASKSFKVRSPASDVKTRTAGVNTSVVNVDNDPMSLIAVYKVLVRFRNRTFTLGELNKKTHTNDGLVNALELKKRGMNVTVDKVKSSGRNGYAYHITLQ